MMEGLQLGEERGLGHIGKQGCKGGGDGDVGLT